MKLAKLSLAALVAISTVTSLNAADTLADAFKNGKVNGTLEAWYWDRSVSGGAMDADLLNFGIKLSYKTDNFYGFSLGTTIQTTNSPFASEDAKIVFKNDQYGPGAVLSEAYLGYQYEKTSLKIGRQFIATPLIASSPSRIIKQSFEGVTLFSQGLIPQTVVFAAFIDKFQNRTNLNGDVADFTDNFWTAAPIPGAATWAGKDGEAYSLMLMNKSIPNITLTGQWVGIKDIANLYYAEADYQAKTETIRYGLAGQYQITDFDNTISANDSGYYGVKASIGVGALNAYVAHSKIGDDAVAIPGVGGGPYGKLYTSQIWLTPGTFNQGAEAYTVDANYMIKSVGLLLGARFSNIDIPVGAGVAAAFDIDYTTLYAKYKFDGALKGLMVDVGYESGDYSKANSDTQEFRFNVNYNF